MSWVEYQLSWVPIEWSKLCMKFEQNPCIQRRIIILSFVLCKDFALTSLGTPKLLLTRFDPKNIFLKELNIRIFPKLNFHIYFLYKKLQKKFWPTHTFSFWIRLILLHEISCFKKKYLFYFPPKQWISTKTVNFHMTVLHLIQNFVFSTFWM